MGYRKLPFGYRMEAGRLEIDPQEAETVRSVFRDYIAGKTYKALAAKLNASDVRYHADKPWNINMIDRILKDKRYLGELNFPAIIDKATLDAAGQICASKTVLQPKTKAEKALRQMLGCRLPKGAGEQAATLLNQLISDTSRIQVPQTGNSNTDGMKALLDKLEELLVQDEVDVTASIEQVKRIAASQYEQLGKGDYETERIRRALENAEPMKELDEETLRCVVSSAQADSNGTITLILKNGQAYKRK